MDYLICSLYTLVPENPVFKNLNLKSDISNQVTYGYHISNNKNFIYLYNLVNKESIRRFAYILIIPFFYQKKYYSFTPIMDGNNDLLKQ